MNVALDKALLLLAPIQAQFTNLSWADLIVLAGNTALDIADNTAPMKFCGGRTDASDGSGSMLLQPNGNYSLSFEEIRREAQQNGLSDREIVALSARLRSPGQMMRSGFYGTWTTQGIGMLSNQYFITLLTETWAEYTTPGGMLEYKAAGKELYMTPYDLNLKWDSTYLAIAEEFAADNTLFLKEFRAAWTHLMNKDRFEGPTGNVCSK
jgi:catalase (peroxidase I)